MKIEHIKIGRYGHFHDVELPLGGDGVQMILGPNEAGKSTLLEFVRELLFGFSHHTPYAFAADRKSPVQGAATLALKNGSRVELTRRKGTKNTVTVTIDGQATGLDETGFSALLSHASAPLFRSIFAFGLGELARGEEMLADQGVKSVLFGGGDAGAANPRRTLDDLEAAARNLYAPRASNPIINQLRADLDKLPKQVREKTLHQGDFERRRKELEEAGVQAAVLAREHLEATRDHELKQKLADALPRWDELNRLRAERAELTAPAGFPSGGLARFETAEANVARLEAELSEARETAAATERELEASQVDFDPRLIDRRAAIGDLFQTIESVKEARGRLPLDQGKRDASIRKATDQLGALVPGWTFDDLRAHRPTAAQTANFERLVEQSEERRAAVADLLRKRDGHLETLRDKEAELLALGDPVDVVPLAVVLADEADHKNDHKELKRLQSERRKLDGKVDDLLPRLNPPLGSPSIEAAALPVPPREAVARAKRELERIEQQIEMAESNIARDETALDLLRGELARLNARGDDLPSRETLESLRLVRDEGWELLRRKHEAGENVEAETRAWLSQNAPESARGLWSAHPEAVAAADRHADNLFDQASAVAKHEQIQAVLAKLDDDRRALEDHRDRLKSAIADWRALWEGCGLVPLDPETMTGWLDRFDELRSLRAGVEENQREAGVVADRVEAFEARLRELMGGMTGAASKLLTVAREREGAARSAEQSRRDLQRDCRKSRRKADEAEAARLDLLAEEPAWAEAWRALLLELRLPPEWDADLAARVLRDLETVRGELEKADAAAADIAARQARLDDFEPRVGDLARELAPDLLDQAPELAAAILQERSTESVKARERKASLDKNLDAARRRIADLDAKLNDERAARSALLEAAGADSADAFRATAALVERIHRLDGDIDARRREFDAIRGREPIDEFAARLDQVDQALLDAQRDEAGAREAELAERKAAADQNVGSRNQALEEYRRGSDEAALLQEQITAKRAQLAAGVDRYVPLIFAQTLLKRAIQRFEQDSQPEVLRETSRIFAMMTDGRFPRVDRPHDDDGQLQVHRVDGRVFDPPQLSTGVREQLYLAVRLAYALHYCGRAEPLPIVMDDVMANFDPQRSRRTLRALGELSNEIQVIMFTCHPHLIEIARDVFPGFQPTAVPAAAGNGS